MQGLQVLYVRVEKRIYQSHSSRDHALSSDVMFQMYQAMCQAEVGEFPSGKSTVPST